MFETLAHVIVYIFAGFGALILVCMIAFGRESKDKEVEAKPTPQPQPQITNLRPVPQPAPVEHPQVLSKTTMQITTTKYADTTEGKKAVADGR